MIGNLNGAKKSQVSPKMLKYVIFFCFVLVMIVFSFIFITSTFRTPYIPASLDETLMISRFKNVCFVYQDPDTLRFYPGVIDENKFTKEQLDECYYAEGSIVKDAYKIKLILSADQSAKEKSVTISTSNWLEDKNAVYRIVPVLVRANDEIKSATLSIHHMKK